MSSIIVRVQTKVGVWRLKNIPLDCSFGQLKQRIEAEHLVPIAQQTLSKDILGKQPHNDQQTLRSAGARNGFKIFFSSDADFGAAGGKGVKTGIDKNGNVVLRVAEDNKRGFRPGLLPLSNIKKTWGISEIDAINSQYTYEFKEPVKLECDTCVMEPQAADLFVTYARQTKFKPRVAFLYGRYKEEGDGRTTVVHAFYEPPQQTDEFGAIEVLPETAESQQRLDSVTNGLQLQKVGCMFCHPFRDRKFKMSSIEALFAAEQQLEACNGNFNEKPNRFVTIVASETEDGQADFQAYQMTRQCMEMVAKGMLLWGLENQFECDIHEMFTALTVKHNKEKTRVRISLRDVRVGSV